MTDLMPVLQVQDLTVSYGDVMPVQGITFAVRPGERIGLVGVNGSGKTTLLRTLAGEVSLAAGKRIEGKTVRLGFLDQQFSQLAQIGSDRVREVLARTKATFTIEIGRASCRERV